MVGDGKGPDRTGLDSFLERQGKKRRVGKRDACWGFKKDYKMYFNLLNNGFDFNNEIQEVKKEMSVLANIESKGVILRSKEREIEGEKCTRYFFNMIITKRGGLTSVKTGGREVNTTKEILEGVEIFYEGLYSFKDVHIDTLKEVLNFIEKRVNCQKEILSQDLNILEIQKALKKGKSPGVDGLPLEFYRTFWDIFGHELLTIFKEFETFDRLPDSFRTGIVSLLHKKGDRTDLKNWRP